MRDITVEIKKKLKLPGYSKKLIYDALGRKPNSFEYALTHKTFSVGEYGIIFKILSIEPNWFFEWESEGAESQSNEEIREVKASEEIETFWESEILFLREQIKTMNDIIKELSKTKN